MKRLIVTGIGTGIGKTLVSSIFVQALAGDYWKPIQAGSLRKTDSHRVRSLVEDRQACIHPESYRLREAKSPHAAAGNQGLRIASATMVAPKTARPLVIEGAGGLLVPLNETELMLDFFKRVAAPVVLVSRHYLGSINHTLLSAEALRARRIPVAGIVFNGVPNASTESVILRHTGFPLLLRVRPEPRWDSTTTRKYAAILRRNLRKYDLV
jgi:dethiobiotin synthetase